MENKKYPQSEIPIRKSKDFLPTIFQTEANDKFLSGTLDALTQPGTLEKTVGYVGKRYGKTFNGTDIYLDTDDTLRSRYQLEPAVTFKENGSTVKFWDYLDFKNMLKFFGNEIERDNLVSKQEHYTWNPPIDWDKFVNYREYYWVPSGPSPIRVLGQRQNVTSSYRVGLSGDNSFVFYPDGFTNNPSITLYRGQTYKFIVNVPGNGFVIRTSYDTGSLLYNSEKTYTRGSLVTFDGKLWRAVNDIPAGDGSTIDSNSQDWEYVAPSTSTNSLNWEGGITNNGIENGTITFTVPFNSPDNLFYQSITQPDRFGQFLIADIDSNTKLNVENEILGKTTYTSSNEIEFSNGMIVNFDGQIIPEKYSTGNWLVEGVGSSITLTLFDSLDVPILSSNVPEVLFDNAGFDATPFDDASAYPGTKDYITIAKSSNDLNPWSRYNRWFHRSILEYSSKLSGSEFTSSESARAKRPIIEFLPNIHLFNHGKTAKQSIDMIDNITTDVFSSIEGSKGYIIDGEPVFEGARILVLADTDSLANNKIYEVKFLVHNGSRQLTLVQPDDSESQAGDVVLVRRGNENSGAMFWFDGSIWNKAQEKTKINQPPLFDAFDSSGISFSDLEVYPVNNFKGTKLLSYKIGNGPVDRELGFSISYLNLDNIGDILFNFDWETDRFFYEDSGKGIFSNLNLGYYKINDQNYNGWQTYNDSFSQPVLDYYIFSEESNQAYFESIDWDSDKNRSAKIFFYLNGTKITDGYTRLGTRFDFDRTFSKQSILTIKIFSSGEPISGYYELPLGLERNPLNASISDFTFGQATNHLSSGLEFFQNFNDPIPGVSSIRDLDDYKVHCNRFLKHTFIAPVALSLLCDKDNNIIKSIQQAKKSYSDFKYNFLKTAEKLYFDQLPNDLVDEVMKEISKTKSSSSLYAESDMIGNGAFSKINYTVEDTGITTFSLTEQFSLTRSSNRAVYVYINNVQLINQTDYVFNDTFGYVQISKSLNLNDEIEIREYVTTTANYIPPTPTKLGLCKKYVPMKFLDRTYVTPKMMIQGHDGSLTTAYGDFRDDAILELEYRIYNNIKQEYNEALFDNDAVLGGYYGNSIYSKDEYSPIISREFLKWVSDTNIDYITNNYFDTENSFTYTYSNMSDPTGTSYLPGYWRGVYRWIYDTDRPHSHPWEMLGFSLKPTWWEDEYGPAPYTRGNLILWEDLENGIIRQGPKAGTYLRYKRPGLINHIPVDDDGNLLSPLDSNFAREFSLINNQGNFKVGDVAPVENAWYISSEYPFAKIIALCILRPFDFIGYALDKPNITINNIEQKISTRSKKFISLEDVYADDQLTIGFYIKEYLKYKNIKDNSLDEFIRKLDVNLSHRMSGFVDQQQQRFLLDSKSPRATTSNTFIPQENQEIFFNVSSPISKIVYSAVIVEKANNGWKIRGYDSQDPYFYYTPAIPTQNDPIITVGGISENFLEWTEDKFYGNGIVVRYNNDFYRSLKSHQSSSNFDTTVWQKLPKLPTVGAVEAYGRRNFKPRTSVLNYGTILTSIQAVVDFLLGYGNYLTSQGFVFDRYDSELRTPQDWTTSSKEFMYWTQHSWATESLISLSPAAEFLTINYQIGSPESLLDNFYDYQIYRSNGTTLGPEFLSFKRDFQNISITVTDTTDGIYLCKLFPVLKEHVAIFSDRTVFNDVIYDKPTGYRQERIKVRGFRTVDWDGDYTSPGFLFDNVNISEWEPYIDYKLGDIVRYKNVFYTSKANQQGQEDFIDNNWTELDLIPNRQLIPNFDYKINQFEDYFNLDADGVQLSQRELGRHLIGYQKRDYLEDIAEDEVTQFKMYQGFIRDKGTSSSISKVFDKSSAETVAIHEEWAIRTAIFGGVDQLNDFEFLIDKNTININPQPILFVRSKSAETTLNRYLEIVQSDFLKSPIPYTTSLFPTKKYDSIQTAGYVKLDQVKRNVGFKDDLLDLDINEVEENDHFFVTFEKNSWTALRFIAEPLLFIIDAVKRQDEVTLTFNRTHNLEVDDIIGIKQIPNLVGFFKIKSIELFGVVISVSTDAQDPLVDYSSIIRMYRFENARVSSDHTLDPERIALLPESSKLWIDNNGNDRWQVIQKTRVFSNKEIIDYGTTNPTQAGKAVIFSSKLNQTMASMPMDSLILIMIEGSLGLHIDQILIPEPQLIPKMSNSFGEALAISPDNKYLVVGAPLATEIKSSFVGNYDPAEIYEEGDIVYYGGTLWKALINDPNSIGAGYDGSTINIANQNWAIADNIPWNPVTGNGNGYRHQGMIFIYEWTGQTWQLNRTLLSPRPDSNEKFGSKISIGVSGSTYWLAVSAPGAVSERGRVYIFKNEGIDWVHHQNSNFRGVYNSDPDNGSTYYPEGSIVWYEGNLWRALEDSTLPDGSTISEFSASWIRVDPISTDCSLPSNLAIDDDGSTLLSGLLSPNDLAELTKEGDKFGFSIAMNSDASVLVVGSPKSDGQYFPKYRGIWRAYQTYVEGDVVKYADETAEDSNYTYYQLSDNREDSLVDSTIESLGEPPDRGLPWVNVGDSSSYASGKVLIYRRDEFNVYKLHQTINSGSLDTYNDTGDSSITINFGDDLGYDVSIDSLGINIIASAPLADIDFQNQGAVYLLSTASRENPEWRVKQKIQAHETYNNLLFGASISITPDAARIVIGAKNAPFRSYATFENGTVFDSGSTTISEFIGYTGQVYAFERIAAKYYLSEKLQAQLFPDESFGYSVFASKDVIVVGSPNYKNNGVQPGMVRTFRKSTNVNSFNIIAEETELVDIESVKNISLLDRIGNIKINDLDFVDYAKLKLLGAVEQELFFKTPYDPAIYTNGIEETVVDPDVAWYEKYKGKVWWDLRRARWLNYEQGDLSYRIGSWNQLAAGASIDVYEWVETRLLPSEWSAIADTADGLALGISGQPLYPNDDVYSVKTLFNTVTGEPSETLYYYWVTGSTILPEGVIGRKISIAEIQQLIINPAENNTPLFAIVDTDKIIAYNIKENLPNDDASINFQLYDSAGIINPIHKEYFLITEGVADSVPNSAIENKWLDSLIGFDEKENPVPEPNLPLRLKYGILNRPRQSIFKDRFAALKLVFESVNLTLVEKPFTDLINFARLNEFDDAPPASLNAYDDKVENLVDLSQLGIALGDFFPNRIKQAVFRANLINGEVDSIDIVESGFGYKTVPFVELEGDGTGATASITIDNQGRVVSAEVLTRGKKYSEARVNIRPFSVLVESDSSLGGFWSLYYWDQVRRGFYRGATQAYDVKKYWSYLDWWKSGYGPTSRIIQQIDFISQEESIDTIPGDLIKIKEYTSGGWAVLERTDDGAGEILGNYTLVGRQNGTIQFLDSLWNQETSALGFDGATLYDTSAYDPNPSVELRKIFDIIKTEIFTDDFRNRWNELFFLSLRYAFHEQETIDWAFKTSFVNVTHAVGELDQKTTYKNDNLDAFIEYLKEVKPYRTSIREFVSKYNKIDLSRSQAIDFDLPAVYSQQERKIIPVTQNNSLINSTPWLYWRDNVGFSITSIEISNAGTGYTSPPRVVIEGGNNDATATAYITNGRVTKILVTNGGSGFISTPRIQLVGGNGSGNISATAVPVLGNSKIRSFDLTLKFDRISKDGIFREFNYSQTFIATGRDSVFQLNFPPTLDKSKIQIFKDSQLVLNNEYTIQLYYNSNNVLLGKLVFLSPPSAESFIEITYDKNEEIFDAVNRINKKYSPSGGMKGNDVGQLMTGIDYGGIQMQGTTFDITGGWDALPWFTDNWDSVEPSQDFYIVVDGSTARITLPYVLESGDLLSVYLQRVGEPRSTRIDDLNYGTDNQTNQNALMPTLLGDGSSTTFEIHDYVRVNDGDVLIFRPFSSDGSVQLNDVNLLDTNLIGGTFDQSSASGLNAEDIKIDGGQFASPENVPAPEENIPGEIRDSVSIKVFNVTANGSPPLQTSLLSSDGTSTRYPIGIDILEPQSVIVYVDDQLFEYLGDSVIDYSIDFATNEIVFNAPPAVDTTIEIIAFGRGGVSLIDYQTFVGDGNTRFFECRADYEKTQSIFVSVDGTYIDVGFVNSTDINETEGTDFSLNKTVVEFAVPPGIEQVIKVVLFDAALDTDSSNIPLVRVNKQSFIFEGSTRIFELTNFVTLSRGSEISSIIVEVNDRKLKGPDTYYRIYDGTNNSIPVGIDPELVVTSVDVRVYINNIVQPFVTAYVYDGTNGEVIVNESVLELNDIIKVEIDTTTEYRIVNNDNLELDSLLDLNFGDTITVTWFSEYPTLDLISDVYSGGKVEYPLKRLPLDTSYIWVYNNGIRLRRDKDFYVSSTRNIVYLNETTTPSDLIEIIEFGFQLFKDPRAWEIHKDMFNVSYYKRYGIQSIELSKDLNYYDQTIEVTDSTDLDDPIDSRNIPGIIEINKEKIQYFSKDGNVLSRLRRGCFGTSIGENYKAGSRVVNLGISEIIPYNDQQHKENFISDGSTIMIGPLETVPAKSERTNWERGTIPGEYGPCDVLEVFVGGRRLRKDHLYMFDEILGSVSPAADKLHEPEFSVDGSTAFVRLTTAVPAGTKITIVRKTGQTWYDRGLGTASTGTTILANTGAIPKFIDQKPTELPE